MMDIPQLATIARNGGGINWRLDNGKWVKAQIHKFTIFKQVTTISIRYRSLYNTFEGRDVRVKLCYIPLSHIITK